MADRLIVLAVRTVLATIAINILAPDISFWSAVLATAALATIPSIQ